VELAVDLRYGHDFVAAIAGHIKALVAAFDTQVKAHVKAHGLSKIADVSRFTFRRRFATSLLTVPLEYEAAYQSWYAD
jgi:transcriptional regulator GlxA family with amidase domain